MRPAAAGYAPAVALLLLLAAGCSERRDEPPLETCVTWKADVEGAVEEQCASCHGGDRPAAGYDLTSYVGALGTGTDDEPNAFAGDGESTLLRALDPARADEDHRAGGELRSLLRRWVVECDLGYRDSSIHPPGILNPRDPEFHGALLEDLGWSFDECRSCHGEDLDGGPADAPCTSCHTEGPTDCATCHRSELRDEGAHGAHFGAGRSVPFEQCEQCHEVPSSFADPGHLFVPGSGLVDSPPAEVALGEMAALTPEGDERAGPPTYDAETGTCGEVYCHGATLGDEAASLTAPQWFRTDVDQAACGTCHGIPPADHAQDECVLCHQEVVGVGRLIVRPELHGDGVVQVGDPEREGCAGCHGTTGSAAPPPDLRGRRDKSLPSVGAHRAHLEAPFRLRGPVACSDCHSVPDAVESAGHIDSPLPAEVFPAESLDGSLAAAAGASPRWNTESRTCENVYCHGGGPRFATDGSDELRRSPRWTDPDPDAVACGTCHGVPPDDLAHQRVDGLRECHDCHDSVDEFGNILLTGPPDAPESRHMDGVLDGR